MTANSNSPQQKTPFSMDDFAQALEQEQYDYHFNKGDTVKGKVFQYDSSGVYVDIGGKSPGFVPLSEASWQNVSNVADVLPLHEEFDFLIIKEQDADGQVKLSRRQLFIEQAWDNLTEIQEKGKVVEMLVTGVNRGGVIGQVDGLRAFIPRSHLIEKDDFEKLIDQSLQANVLQIDRPQNKIVLTQRNIARSSAMSQLQEGELVQGKIVKIQPYGVFVDFGGIAGLLHIKQISEGQISSLSNLFKIGEEIKVVVLEIDEMKNRISLSTKVLETYPGEFVEKKDLVMETAETRFEQKKAKSAG
ncbi:S1 RNA-binding domain-containing protein [Geminocystis sp. NIES-3709]|uniref:S1 RNA-binding domain-containing protein n=1 Tax=Geminocystis sp. NIES-3709 TaxID=1617448 RepID=UPI0005FC3EC3|nr:S1 RNA-binding domain-containing protein [Geminocystis sp. NIES-3709]BAQ64181.1 SSU ribosomal protein S1p [Geminocystis sp. NIES-3709]